MTRADATAAVLSGVDSDGRSGLARFAKVGPWDSWMGEKETTAAGKLGQSKLA